MTRVSDQSTLMDTTHPARAGEKGQSGDGAFAKAMALAGPQTGEQKGTKANAVVGEARAAPANSRSFAETLQLSKAHTPADTMPSDAKGQPEPEVATPKRQLAEPRLDHRATARTLDGDGLARAVPSTSPDDQSIQIGSAHVGATNGDPERTEHPLLDRPAKRELAPNVAIRSDTAPSGDVASRTIVSVASASPEHPPSVASQTSSVSATSSERKAAAAVAMWGNGAPDDRREPARTDHRGRTTLRDLSLLQGALQRAGADLSQPTLLTPSLMESAALSPTIVRRETHFAPVARLDLAATDEGLQLALPGDGRTAQGPATPLLDQLRSVLRAPEAMPANASGEASAAPRTAAAPTVAQLTSGPVRILELALQPASLGTLAVTLRLTPGGLKVTVSATSRETAALLDDDRHALQTLMADAGYAVDALVVETVSATSAATNGNPAPSAQRQDTQPTEPASPEADFDVVARWVQTAAAMPTLKV